ncbi:MAG: Lrp/AsnC family transcriptional regulator [Candidatus Kariarchaeaceae archaeon]|jgi:DNA-binding Lrp family transcriptional regulator
MEEEIYALDQFDKRLLKLLQENSRMKNTELAKQLQVTEGAIRKRINKLVNNKFIEKFTIQVNEKALGMRAVVEIQITGNSKPSVIVDKILSKVDKGIEAIYETAGDVDLIVIFHTSSDSLLKMAIEQVRSIDGVVDTKTHVVLNRTKLPQQIF